MALKSKLCELFWLKLVASKDFDMDEADACRRGFTLSSFLLRLERAELEFLPSVGEPGLLTLEALLGEALLDESSDAAV